MKLFVFVPAPCGHGINSCSNRWGQINEVFTQKVDNGGHSIAQRVGSGSANYGPRRIRLSTRRSVDVGEVVAKLTADTKEFEQRIKKCRGKKVAFGASSEAIRNLTMPAFNHIMEAHYFMTLCKRKELKI